MKITVNINSLPFSRLGSFRTTRGYGACFFRTYAPQGVVSWSTTKSLAISKYILLLILLSMSSRTLAGSTPPYTDYCAMLARDIQGIQHGFLAGKHLYYCGGKTNADWKVTENETLGFTHPLFRDGRARGYGIVTDTESGTGHDKWGWEFWRETRVAYGTVIVDGQPYAHPVPKQMIWRPDRQICRYEVAGITIEETKFINADDVLCAIIQTSQPIRIEFEGQSYFKPGNLPTFDGDPAEVPFQFGCTSTAVYDQQYNALHITERSGMMTKTAWHTPARPGRMMYDGRHVVLSASEPLGPNLDIEQDPRGFQRYRFQVTCRQDRPLVLCFAMDDAYERAAQRSQALLKHPQAHLQAKTRFMNDLLNQQIPYFRCSDEKVVQSYYYLWSLYFMYFTDTDKGWEIYPHTQTAVNNFMGLHLWDSWAYAAMGSWVADKWSYGHGNVLAWQFMVPFKNKGNALPDNFGIGWYSPGVWMNFVGVTEFAWQQYLQSGDRKFLQEAYDRLFRPLYWTGPSASFGIEINAAHALINMARTLGRPEDVEHWRQFVNRRTPPFVALQNRRAADEAFYWDDIWPAATLMSDAVPHEAAARLVNRCVMDTENGLVGPVALDVRPPTQPENGVFAVSTISTWQVIEGMFRHDLAPEALYCTLSHLSGMVRDHGFPIAPECWDPDYRPWGSMCYNWDGAMVNLLVGRLAGIRYSIPDQQFTVQEHLPDAWTFAETYTPVRVNSQTQWVHVRTARETVGNHTRKTVTVQNNPLERLIIEPWLEDRALIQSTQPRARTTRVVSTRHVFNSTQDTSISMILGERTRTFNTLAYLLPHSCDFADTITVHIENLIPNTLQRYTTDGSPPTAQSPPCPAQLTFTRDTELKIRAFGTDGTIYRPMVAHYRKSELHPASNPEDLHPGLRYAYYEGQWKRLPDFDSLTPKATGTAEGLDVVTPPQRATHFALCFEGYLDIPADDVYTFHVLCNDGARVFVDGETVVELDGTRFEARERAGRIGLKQGKHALRVEYFQSQKRRTLKLFYETPSMDRTEFSSKELWHTKQANDE